MAAEAYEILSLAMRYVFVALGALIVFRAWRWLLRDQRAYKKELRSLPDAGLVGEIVAMDSGKSYPLPREGTIGSGRACDIRLKRDGIRRVHATLRFVDGKGVQVIPHGSASVVLDGDVTFGKAFALHGSVMELGDCPLRVRLFAGLNVPRLAPSQPDLGALVQELPEDDPFLDDQMTWGYAPYPPQMLREMAQMQQNADIPQEYDPFDNSASSAQQIMSAPDDPYAMPYSYDLPQEDPLSGDLVYYPESDEDEFPRHRHLRGRRR